VWWWQGRRVEAYGERSCGKRNAKVDTSVGGNPIACGGQGHASLEVAGGDVAQLFGIIVSARTVCSSTVKKHPCWEGQTEHAGR
jgi:hypothetical protein